MDEFEMDDEDEPAVKRPPKTIACRVCGLGPLVYEQPFAFGWLGGAPGFVLSTIGVIGSAFYGATATMAILAGRFGEIQTTTIAYLCWSLGMTGAGAVLMMRRQQLVCGHCGASVPAGEVTRYEVVPAARGR